MKRLSEIKVKKQGEVLTDEEMKAIKGGDSYILCMASNGRWFTTDSYAVADAGATYGMVLAMIVLVVADRPTSNVR